MSDEVKRDCCPFCGTGFPNESSPSARAAWRAWERAERLKQAGDELAEAIEAITDVDNTGEPYFAHTIDDDWRERSRVCVAALAAWRRAGEDAP